MRALVPDWEIDSAGTGSWHLGDPPHPDAIAAAAERGYDLSAQRARRVARGDFARFDRIVVMDGGNLTQMERLRPKGNTTPVARLLDHAPETGVRDVPDPYMTGGFDRTLDLIEAGCRGLLAEMAR